MRAGEILRRGGVNRISRAKDGVTIIPDPFSVSPGPALSAADWTEPLPPVTLILGGPRSGKGAYARRLIERRGAGLLVATTRDGEEARAPGGRWTALPAPLDIARLIMMRARADRPILVESLSHWAAELVRAGRDVAAESLRLADALTGISGAVVLVSTTGDGGSPRDPRIAWGPGAGDGMCGEDGRDRLAVLHQTLVARADRVVFMLSSVPLIVKDAVHEQVVL